MQGNPVEAEASKVPRQMESAAKEAARRYLCPAEQERRGQVRRDFLAFYVFRNATEHEEYRPS